MTNNSVQTYVVALFTALLMSGLVLVVSAIGEIIDDKQFTIASKQGFYIVSGTIFILLSFGTLLIRKKKHVDTYIIILLLLAGFFMGIFTYLTL